jgi:hypothetical protein
VTPADVTGIGGLILSLIALVVLPLVFKQQAAKQLREREEREQIKEAAQRDAATAAGETVSWEKINQRLAITLQEERAAHQQRIAELRESFAAEVERTKRRTDEDLDRAMAEIARLVKHVRMLEGRVAQLTAGR